jgi:hypothetical protein
MKKMLILVMTIGVIFIAFRVNEVTNGEYVDQYKTINKDGISIIYEGSINPNDTNPEVKYVLATHQESASYIRLFLDNTIGSFHYSDSLSINENVRAAMTSLSLGEDPIFDPGYILLGDSVAPTEKIFPELYIALQ